MLRLAGIIGYKNSGKTTLTHALARELTSRGYEVAVVKHAHHPLDLPGKDTAVLGESSAQVAIISAQESALLWKKPLSLEDILLYLEADIVLVEGFKREKTFPKVACLRGQPDDRDLFDGLLIAAVLPLFSPGGGGEPGGSTPATTCRCWIVMRWARSPIWSSKAASSCLISIAALSAAREAPARRLSQRRWLIWPPRICSSFWPTPTWTRSTRRI